MKIFYCKNEGPFCGCWSDGWVVATPEATPEEIDEMMGLLAQELTEHTYELCADENECDSIDEEDLYLDRDEEIAGECLCTIGDFELADETYEQLLEYGLFEEWNARHTVCYMVNV